MGWLALAVDSGRYAREKLYQHKSMPSQIFIRGLFQLCVFCLIIIMIICSSLFSMRGVLYTVLPEDTRHELVELKPPNH